MVIFYYVDDKILKRRDTIERNNKNEKLEDIVPDLVLLDVMLPDESGYDIVRKLRKNPATKRLPIIMVTAKTAEMDMIKGLDEEICLSVKRGFSLAHVYIPSDGEKDVDIAQKRFLAWRSSH